MRPTPTDVHINRPMSAISVAYMQDQTQFVADRIFPTVPVDKQSDLYWVFNRADFMRDEMKLRGPATESAGGGFSMSNDAYFCHVWAFHKDLDEQTEANADVEDGLDLDTDITNYLALKALINREKRWCDSFFKTGVWASEQAGVASAPTGTQFLQWNDANSTPIEQIRAARLKMSQYGFAPNVLVMSPQAWAALLDHPDIIDRLKYGQTAGSVAMVSKTVVAALFEVDRIEVLAAVENIAAEGLAESIQWIAGKHAALYHVPPRAGRRIPAAGYRFVWRKFIGSISGQRVKKFYMPPIESWRNEIEVADSMKVIGSDLGHFMSNVVA